MLTNSAGFYSVERQWSNGVETCPHLKHGAVWVATVVGSPHLGHDSVPRAEEIARKLNAHDALVAACKAFLARVTTTPGDPTTFFLIRPTDPLIEAIRAAVTSAKGDAPC